MDDKIIESVRVIIERAKMTPECDLRKVAHDAIEAYETERCAAAFHKFLDISLAKACSQNIGPKPSDHDLGFAKGVEMTVEAAANRIRELEDALKPFAEAAGHPINVAEDGELPDLALNSAPFTMYTIRRARAVLDAGQAKNPPAD